MKKTILVLIFTIIALSWSDAFAKNTKAKYVFYFIGDGMGFSHISIAEAYQAHLQGKNGSTPLSFTQFPVMGMATTYSASNMVTCSSAAGTALSTGYKTNNGFLGVLPDSSKVESISYKIHKAGYKVGITTTVSLDHATPGAFYANSTSRDNYYEISQQLPSSQFEFFGGGGFISPNGKDKNLTSSYDNVEEMGYIIASGIDDYKAKKQEGKKMVLLQKEGKESHELKYAIDMKEGDMKLSDIVSAATDFLNNKKGFFLMAEGGKIDWGGHANDAKTTIMEVIDFSNAITVAYNFYLEHPDETLIVVTADHETGGFSMAREKGYQVYLDELKELSGSKDFNKDEDYSKKVDLATEKARLSWTTKSHSGVAVPVFAIGQGSNLFSGRMDNTEIPKKICTAMGVKFE